MIAWLKSLFAGMDRQTAAAERAAKASEDIADMLEAVRDQFRTRLGIEAHTPALPAATGGRDSNEDEPAKGKKGRER